MQATSDKSGNVTAPRELQDKLRARIEKEGERAALSKLKLGRFVAARILGGLPVRKGTIAQLRAALTEK